MDFHAEFFPKPFSVKIEHHHKLMLAGSCFTEQIGNKLSSHKFNTLQNPNGILFNPASISRSVISYCKGVTFSEENLFYHNELWNSWQHHSRFSGMEKKTVLENINRSQAEATSFIKKADWLLITLGSAFVYRSYEINAGNFENVVANCHKIPTDKFERSLLETEEIKEQLNEMTAHVFAFNPTIKVIYTISPVRHLREGFIENNRSKAALINAVHSLVNDKSIFYFPAYELVIDDLRDYRFYAEDMVHPNYSATNYVWEKFISTCIDERSQAIMKEISVINAAVNHKAFNPLSEQHKKFRETHLEKIKRLIQKHHYLNFDREILVLSKSG